MEYRIILLVLVSQLVLVISQEDSINVLEYACGNKPADVVFLLDSSNSIWGPDFRRQIDFVESITDLFTIGKNTTRVGLISYSHDIKVEFGLDEYYNKKELLDAIQNTKQYSGYKTNTRRAIHFARMHMFGHKNHRDKNTVSRIIIVLTDGQSSNLLMTVWESIKAKNEGIRVFSVGVGPKINKRELTMMASSPTNEHMFLVNSYGALKSIKQILAVQTCKVTPKTTPATTTSTTTTTTTTTLPTTTTESLYAAATRACLEDIADVVFAFDSSNSVSREEFQKQIEFAQRISKNFHLGPDKSRIGSILYSDQVQRLIDLPEYENHEDIVHALSKVEKSAGGSRVDQAIRYIRTKSFRRSVVRRHVSQVAIIITASPTSNLPQIKKQAHEARKSGITLIPIGIGDVDLEDLKAIAGTTDDTLQYYLPSFDELDLYIPNVAINTCEVTAPSITVSDMSCGSRQEADLVFILDSINAGKKNTKKALEFVKDLVNDLDVDKDKIQVGLMSEDVCESNSKTSNGFNLGSMSTKEDAMDALQDKQEIDFGHMLKKMRKGAFSHRHGARREARKIAIIIVDGNLNDPIRALSEADRARLHGIEVYVVQVGEDEPQQELLMISDSPFKGEKNFFKVKNYNELKKLKKNIWDSLCDEL